MGKLSFTKKDKLTLPNQTFVKKKKKKTQKNKTKIDNKIITKHNFYILQTV